MKCSKCDNERLFPLFYRVRNITDNEDEENIFTSVKRLYCDKCDKVIKFT